MDFLGSNRELLKELEVVAGFSLNGMNIGDLFQAIAEPDGPADSRVKAFLSEGLAGQAGSKASERMEDAAAPARTVKEVVADITSREVFVEVDDETAKEDLEKIENARTHERMEKVVEDRERVAEAQKEAAASGETKSSDPEHSAEMVQQLAAQAEIGEQRAEFQDDADQRLAAAREEVAALAEGVPLALEDGDIDPASASGGGRTDVMLATLRAYLETLPENEERELTGVWLGLDEVNDVAKGLLKPARSIGDRG